MKRFFSVVLISAMCCSVFAQPGEGRGPHSGRGGGARPDMAALIERIQAEKIAYITEQLDLSSSEAEKFWPVYNALNDRQKELMSAEHKAYRELRGAVESKSAETEARLNAYIAAKKANVSLNVENAEEYLKVLSPEKTARLFVAEENFRRMQIGKLRGGGDGNPRGGVPPRR